MMRKILLIAFSIFIIAPCWGVNDFEELEGYSPCLNSVISLTESDYHTIVIEGEDWIANGVIE